MTIKPCETDGEELCVCGYTYVAHQLGIVKHLFQKQEGNKEEK